MRNPHWPDSGTGWHTALGMFAFCQGLRMCLIQNLFQAQPQFSYLAKQMIPQTGWAAILLAYSVATTFFLVFHLITNRAILCAMGAALWLWLGTEMLAGSIPSRSWSAEGLFEIMAGVGCVVAIAQVRSFR